MKNIPILHMIDSLSIGGAERMAVNLVNSILHTKYEPHLCITRQSGQLIKEVNSNIGILHLDRKGRLDFCAIKNCYAYLRMHDIKIIHAHGSSIFLAILLSWFNPSIAVLWHLHGVEFKGMTWKKKCLYRWAIHRSDGIACVSEELMEWTSSLAAEKKTIWYLPNFIPSSVNSILSTAIELPGTSESRVICVSNLKCPKDHFTLLESWKIVQEQYPQAQLIIVGGDDGQKYAKNVLALINNSTFINNVTWLGARSDVPALLRECQIGVLSSRSEGFPLTLLEYGSASLGVVASNVGQCAEILEYGKAGVLVPPGDPVALAAGLLSLISDQSKRQKMGNRLCDFVVKMYSQKTVITQLLAIYANIQFTRGPKKCQHMEQ